MAGWCSIEACWFIQTVPRRQIHWLGSFVFNFCTSFEIRHKNNLVAAINRWIQAEIACVILSGCLMSNGSSLRWGALLGWSLYSRLHCLQAFLPVSFPCLAFPYTLRRRGVQVPGGCRRVWGQVGRPTARSVLSHDHHRRRRRPQQSSILHQAFKYVRFFSQPPQHYAFNQTYLPYGSWFTKPTLHVPLPSPPEESMPQSFKTFHKYTLMGN